MVIPKSKSKILAWEVTGCLWIFLAGSALHFVFAWSGNWRPLAICAPVNESIWEHLKLGFWPGLVFACIELMIPIAPRANLITAKCLGLITMPLVVISLYYFYTAILGDNYLPVDISIFALSVLAGQMVSYRFLTRVPPGRNLTAFARFVFFALLLSFILFSFFPPALFLFEHAQSESFGIIEP